MLKQQYARSLQNEADLENKVAQLQYEIKILHTKNKTLRTQRDMYEDNLVELHRQMKQINQEANDGCNNCEHKLICATYQINPKLDIKCPMYIKRRSNVV